MAANTAWAAGVLNSGLGADGGSEFMAEFEDACEKRASGSSSSRPSRHK